jgi:hypothetical protein
VESLGDEALDLGARLGDHDLHGAAIVGGAD